MAPSLLSFHPKPNDPSPPPPPLLLTPPLPPPRKSSPSLLPSRPSSSRLSPQLQEIKNLLDAKNKISCQIQSKDSALLAFAHKVMEAERVLDILVDDCSDYRRSNRSKLDDDAVDNDGSTPTSTTVASQLNLSDILSYAHRISYTTFAPPELGSGQAPLRSALPPAPQEEQMRASQLYNFVSLDVGLPKIVDNDENTVEPIIEPPAPMLAEPNLLVNLATIQGMLHPNITVPSGWKPGMPVELPINLPMPRPGWKPGDPVPLPPLESLPVPRVGEQQFRPKPPEPIQVRPVQLDIIDQHDDSSDYSSDDGTSDDVD